MTEPSTALGNDHIPGELIKLGSFEWPRSEARQTLGHLFHKLKAGFSSGIIEVVVDAEEIDPLSNDLLKNSARDLLAECLLTQLDNAYLDWARMAEGGTRRRAFVHPPMRVDALSDWARQRDVPIMEPGGSIDSFADARCVVIPKLETFFSRHHTKLGLLFELFNDLSHFDGKVIVGCNSWAWQFLKQFDDAHLLFDDTLTIPAFNADALEAILTNAVSKTRNPGDVTSVASGKPVLARDTDNALIDPLLEEIAGLSLGLPWVAIEIFFHGVGTHKDAEGDLPDNPIWIDIPEPCSLPTSGADALRFALHALVLHGPRTPDELSKLLPHRTPNGLWAELERTGFIEMRDGIVHCTPEGYPYIRSELGTAGFNLDKL